MFLLLTMTRPNEVMCKSWFAIHAFFSASFLLLVKHSSEAAHDLDSSRIIPANLGRSSSLMAGLVISVSPNALLV
jgi:hypothetical protein